jgi:diguanylate cyclase (GGDEF)-like protein
VPSLLAYAAFLVGIVALTHSAYGRRLPSLRIDGAIAGFSLAALAARLWFSPVLAVSGRALQVVVGTAYPVCDLVLIVALVSGWAPQRYRPNLPTALLTVGMGWFVLGDIVRLNQGATHTYLPGTPLDATWLVGVFLLGLAASVDDRRDGTRGLAGSSRELALVPVAFGVLSLAVLAFSLHRRESAVSPSLAVVALGLVIARMGLSLREVATSAANFADARTDHLTGLLNRRAFLERLEVVLGEDTSDGVGVLLVDLDGFKEVNDALGHAAGDDLLRVAARRMQARVGDGGIFARLGGDAFACAYLAISEEALIEIARGLSEVLSEPCVLDGVSVRVGASVGVVATAPPGSKAADLLRGADVAMYEAKRAQLGVSVYRSDLDPHGRDRLALIDDLREAIDTGSFTLHYQPTLDMGTTRVCGLEALIRWEHPTHGLLLPDSFIPLAERIGLMPRLTRAVLDRAVRESDRLARAGYPLRMSVNISRHDLVDDNLAGFVRDVLSAHGLPADRLTLEITESSLGGDPDRAEHCVQELRALGVRVSIDDFGVGFSSMSQLLGLAIDEIKIDKSFVMALMSSPRAQAIVFSTVDLARALGVTLVAEGIESLEAFRALRRMGVEIGQGYYIARPLPPGELDAYLQRRSLDEWLPESHTAPARGPSVS